ncbi:MAG: imidazoleglycerol-phosphate dehydratase [Spirochaetae bacterium HGW-Spirochaetae-3]|jgi:imidazoleglycerol-phosphate dehydratase|nr:MAG: imidazoleglycerol-phosphate dehydratase [Spirochaetae bacterium HGW-Spirochaetae-3]
MCEIVTPRSAIVERLTKETNVRVALSLVPGPVDVRTGVGFLDHLLSSLAFHGGFSLSMTCDGDLRVDDHHSAEDCALALGAALRQALGDKAGIRRFGSAFAPLDESLARAVVDLSGRPCAVVDLGLTREAIGGLACENVTHVVTSLANAAMATIHLDVLRGANDHHRAEAAFKALALALREAVTVDGAYGSAVPSAKGTL